MLCSGTALEGAENVLIMHTAHPEQQWGLWGLSEGSGSYRRAIGLNQPCSEWHTANCCSNYIIVSSVI